MAAHEVRDVERKYNLWGGFRDEMIATAMTLSLLMIGSFMLTERLLSPPPKSSPQPIAQAPMTTTPAQPQTLGAQDVAPPVIDTPTTTHTESNDPQATASAEALSEVPYGEDGGEDFEGYSIRFERPRITFESKTNTKRKLWVNVWIKNKSIESGISCRLTASIIKDGVVIVPAAALHTPNCRTVGIGEQMSFVASISLIEATDVRELKYKPGNDIVEATHYLYQ